VRIAAWNIDTVGDPDVLEPVEYEAALAILLRIDADIVALNQIAGDDDGFHLRALATEAGSGHVVVPESNPLGAQRNAIISRFAFAEEPTLDVGRPSSADPSRGRTANPAAAETWKGREGHRGQAEPGCRTQPAH
jgi:hypothetical protein